jgi:hypothetical protein
MFSAEEEEVKFRENIYPTGNVEDWMLEIERVMKESLRKIIADALEDYKKVIYFILKIGMHQMKKFFFVVFVGFL